MTNERVWGHIRARCRVGLRCLGGLALVVTLTAATCTTGASVHLEATPSSLAQAAASTRQGAYRTETTLSFGETVTERLAWGAVDGDRFAATVDLQPLLRALGDQLPGLLSQTDPGTADTGAAVDGWTVDMVGDCSALYVRSTVYDYLHALGPPRQDPKLMKELEDPELMKELGRLDDEWGHIDLVATGELRPVHVSSELTPYENPDPRELLDLLLSGVASVEDLGARTVRGQDLAGLTADVHIADLIEVLGQQADEVAGQARNAFERDVVRRTLGMTTPIEVWINDDGLVHRIDFQLALDHIADETGEDRSLLARALTDAGIHVDRAYTVDYFDHAEKIAIDVPDTTFDLSEHAVTALS